MRIASLIMLTVWGAVLMAGPASAQELIVFPAQGQSDDQMEQDKFACYSWAKKETGFDPMAPPSASAPPPQKEAEEGGVVRGAARGALVGVAAGAIAGDAGKGAAIGAAGGGLLGGMRRSDQRRREEHNQQQWEQEQARQYTQKRSTYNRAYSACLEGKGYTVK
ncbi:MAG: YMGG-like glycine zipper-containing protein [Desulfobacterales bacterium]|jgi:hypothetical protein